jgi:hypothetical protein
MVLGKTHLTPPSFPCACSIIEPGATRTIGWHVESLKQRYQVDIRAVVARHNSKPSIRIESNACVGRYQGEDYFLGSVQIGLQSAVRQVLTIKREDQGWRCSAEIANVSEFLGIRAQIARVLKHSLR